MVHTGGKREKKGFWDWVLCTGVEGRSKVYLRRLELKPDFERCAGGLRETWKDPPSRGNGIIRN